MDKKNHSAIATIAISLLLSLTAIIAAIPLSLTSPPLVANGQPERPLPVLLIHGYRSTHNVWDEWEDRLRDEGIYTITFPRNDECGSAADHAIQLNQIVRDFKEEVILLLATGLVYISIGRLFGHLMI